MKKGFLVILSLILSIQITLAQTHKEITILYLLPLHLDETIPDISTIESDMDIYEIPSFEMIGFWEGAKLALQTYEDSPYKVNVIVRDVTTDEQKLKSILNDAALMKDVDLIIGPFYGALFPIAASYAQDHNITIINPFSTRTDFVSENPSVYKLVPPLTTRPETLHKKMFPNYSNYQVILWYDQENITELGVYENYFKENKIPYILSKLQPETFSLKLELEPSMQNVIIALFQNRTNIINQMRLFSGIQNQFPCSLVFPEEWLNISSLDDDFYSIPNLFYLTNCFVDLNNTTIIDYKNHYVETYQSPCQLERYSFQGYDITKYFIDQYLYGSQDKTNSYTPMVYKFKFKQWTKGGFENEKIRLIHIENFEKKEVD
ncbi:MAG: cwlS [Bacteroidetes bacterium]|nr:cwlS [Bacteroidota bacterium]